MSSDVDPPLKTLKKISEMHDDLERSSEKMSRNLEQLRNDNQQQDVRINESLSAIQLQQKRTLRLLQSRWNSSEDYESQNFAGQISKQLRDWNVSDVIRWLEDRKLHKFIILFQKHHVTGLDLADLKLPFLENYDHISVDEREILLAEIYHLLNPVSIGVSEEDLTKIHSPLERQKYFAAVELAQAPRGNLPRSTSVLVLPTARTPSLSSSSSQSSPRARPKFKSESESVGEMRTKKSMYDIKLTDTKKRKTMPNLTKKPQAVSVYDYISMYGTKCVKTVQVSPQKDGSHGITVVTDQNGHVIIDRMTRPLIGKINKGDRVLEINGIPVLGKYQIIRELEGLVQMAMREKSPAQIVVLQAEQQPSRSVTLGDYDGEEKWNKLRTMLVEMRDTEMEVSTDLPDISPDKLQEVKDRASLLADVEMMKDKLKEQDNLLKEVQADLESKSAMVHDLELSRDKAVEKLKQARNRARGKDSEEVRGGTEYYNITMESLNSDSLSKEELLQSLKEIVKEASRQKWYLDRLISLVIEETPWMLDEVDSDIDHLTLTDQPEEYC